MAEEETHYLVILAADFSKVFGDELDVVEPTFVDMMANSGEGNDTDLAREWWQCVI